MQSPPRVFISYSIEGPKHVEWVVRLAAALREAGIDARIDRYESHPPMGWPRWMMEQLEAADYVVAVCTPTYKERFEGRVSEGPGRGVNWEGFLATQLLYDARARTSKFVPVRPPGAGVDDVPLALRAFGAITLEDGAAPLVDHLLGRAAVPIPPVVRRVVSGAGLPVRPSEDEAWRSLERLLLDLYEVEEARRWARYLDADLHGSLPSGSPGAAEFFGRLVDGMRRRGLVDRAFFADRMAERGGRRAGIEGVAGLFVAAGVIELDPGPEAVASDPPVQPPVAATRWPDPPPPEPPEPPRAWGPLPRTSLHLDRIAQWQDVRSRAWLQRPQVFLFHGPANQALHHFVHRVANYLNEHDEPAHGRAQVEVCTIPTSPVVGGIAERCDSAAAWVNRIRVRVDATGGTLAQVIERRTANGPLLLLLGPAPFSEAPHGTPLDVFNGFLDAVADSYAPTLLTLKPRHAVHLFVPIHGPAYGRFVTEARAVFVEGVERGIWGFHSVASEVHYPSPDEVRHYVTSYLQVPPPPGEWWRRLELAVEGCRPHYDQLSAALDALLAEVWPGL